MTLDLNLLPSRAKFHSARLKVRSNLMKATVVLGGGVIFLGVVIGGYWWWWRQRLTRTELIYQKNMATLVANQGVSSKEYELKYKARLIGKLLEGRYEYGRSYQKVAGLMSGGVRIKESRMIEKESFEVKLEIVDTESMADLEDRVKEIEEGRAQDFSEANFRSVEMRGGRWEVVMEVKLK